MNSQVISVDEITFEQVLALAQQLRTVDQARLIARLAPKVEQLLEQIDLGTSHQSGLPLRGLLSDLGPAPSAAEINEMQQEMWATFAQE